MFFKKDKGKDDKKAAISAEELLLAQKFLKKYEEYDETARFMSVVTNKAKKDSRLVLVLGNYFLFTIKEKGGTLGSGGKPKISRLVYYVDLLQVEIQSRSLVFIKFRERGKESDEKSKRISIAGSTGLLQLDCLKTGEMVDVLRKCCHSFSSAWPMSVKPCFPIDTTSSLGLSSSSDESGGESVLEAYRAFCVALKSQISPEFVRFVTDVCFLRCQDLKLSDCPGTQAKSSITPTLLPIFEALKYHNYFKSFTLVDCLVKDSVTQIAKTIVRHNTEMTMLVLSGLAASPTWPLIGAALRRNAANSFQILDFSNNRLDFEAGASIAYGIQTFTHGILELNLSNCLLPSKGIAALFRAFNCNFGVSMSLEHLNLSYNTFDDSASQAMADWLKNVQQHSQLRTLKVAGTGADISVIGKHFRYLPHLSCLDLSDNKLDLTDCQVLTIALDTTASLSKVSIARCVTKGDLLVPLLKAISHNKSLSRLNLDIGKNKLEEKEVQPLSQIIFQEAPRILALDLTAIKMRERDLSAILFAIGNATPSNIESLVLDYNVTESSPAGADEIARSLVHVLEKCGKLQALSIRGYGPRVCEPVLVSLAANRTVREIRLADNDLRDGGASLLATCLRYNSALQFLECDENFVSMNGWQAILNAFMFNKTLCYFQHPWGDYVRCLTRIPQNKHDRVREIIASIQTAVIKNLARMDKMPEFYFDTKAPTMSATETPTEPRSLAPIPDHLLEIQRNNTLMETAQREGLDEDDELVWEGTLHTRNTKNRSRPADRTETISDEVTQDVHSEGVQEAHSEGQDTQQVEEDDDEGFPDDDEWESGGVWDGEEEDADAHDDEYEFDDPPLQTPPPSSADRYDSDLPAPPSGPPPGLSAPSPTVSLIASADVPRTQTGGSSISLNSSADCKQTKKSNRQSATFLKATMIAPAPPPSSTTSRKSTTRNSSSRKFPKKQLPPSPAPIPGGPTVPQKKLPPSPIPRSSSNLRTSPSPTITKSSSASKVRKPKPPGHAPPALPPTLPSYSHGLPDLPTEEERAYDRESVDLSKIQIRNSNMGRHASVMYHMKNTPSPPSPFPPTPDRPPPPVPPEEELPTRTRSRTDLTGANMFALRGGGGGGGGPPPRTAPVRPLPPKKPVPVPPK